MIGEVLTPPDDVQPTDGYIPSAEELSAMVYGPETNGQIVDGNPTGILRTTVEVLLEDPASLFETPAGANYRSPNTYTMPSGDE